MQSWQTEKKNQNIHPELAEFFLSPIGKLFTHRLVMAAHQSIRYGCGGIRGLQEFLQLSWLENVVASSVGALEAFSVRYEEHLVTFGTQELRVLRVSNCGRM